MLVVSIMDAPHQKDKRAGMTEYEKRKFRVLVFIAAVLFVWATVSVSTIIQVNNTQAIVDNAQAVIEEASPQTTLNELLSTMSEIADRLERLENR